MPWPLSRRITAERAASSIARGITDRAATTIAPAGWRLYSLLRGVLNPVVDGLLVKDARMRALISDIERVAASDHVRPATNANGSG
ncbi:hypothetical protein [Mycobacterium sp. TY814]|uniref:hypothetical protein n=1 Tax=unclassified Mycobacterium TaxID=2642494 RepID=UPI002741C326|nr:hypothetical protein [Mycobacterium sp. TY814]MDP7721570.1 hypothetical protein [Mycobacterium sp. TY814]